MMKTSEMHFDASGNPTARAILSVDESVAGWDFVRSYEIRLFEYFRSGFSSIADNVAANNLSRRKKLPRPVTISVALRRIKLKKTYLIEAVSCDIGTKNLYKSRIIHVFLKVGDGVVYRGTRKKTIAEKQKTASNI